MKLNFNHYLFYKFKVILQTWYEQYDTWELCKHNHLDHFCLTLYPADTSLRTWTNNLCVGMDAVIKLWSRWQKIFNTFAATCIKRCWNIANLHSFSPYTYHYKCYSLNGHKNVFQEQLFSFHIYIFPLPS